MKGGLSFGIVFRQICRFMQSHSNYETHRPAKIYSSSGTAMRTTRRIDHWELEPVLNPLENSLDKTVRHDIETRERCSAVKLEHQT